jgi:hypothetical protein
MLWRNGEIDRESSWIYVGSLAPVITLGGPGLMETTKFDVDRATFRATGAAA